MKIMVGLSGGVDSAAAALILKEQGLDVAGATFRMLGDDGSWDGAADAQAVAKALGIPHYIFDFRELFEHEVLENFLNEYRRGRTPNPCVLCNRKIKFTAFLERARELGYECIATGHYARTDGEHLYRARNLEKDQSYVLYNLNREILPYIRFPLEDKSKTEIRAMARWAGLPVADKPDSQDICFIPDGDTARFLDEHLPDCPHGDFLDEHGRVIGEHRGIIHYTIGQRKGLGISFPEPRFVGKIDADKNTVVLVPNEELFSNTLFANNFNWISGTELRAPEFLCCKIRYAHAPASCMAGALPGGRVRVIFDEPQRALTAGQSAVLYKGEELLGGGIIE